MPAYGKLSNRKIEDQQAGARIEAKDHKRNPGDFVLWKQSEAHEPGWPAHFHFNGSHADIFGRPGWHIECSVMSRAHLGDVFDIHGGGLDLIFPHHENEIAQSCCANGTPVMANYWMHNGFLQLEGKKMSKSDGNFVTINELLTTTKFGGRAWPGEVLRLAMLMTHYREPIDFSVRRLEEAEDIIKKWKRQIPVATSWNTYERMRSDWQAIPITAFEAFDPLLNDLDAYGFVQNISKLASDPDPLSALQAFALAQRFGLLSFDHIKSLSVDEGVAILVGGENALRTQVANRLALLAAKNFAEADRIRDELAAQGIQLMDYKDPETGERRTKWEIKR
jgi:cysteinyl-tRNA synthetase